MDKTTRYLILIFICIVFFALAPLIVIYVSGKGFTFSDSSAGTGILDIQSDPSSAQVFLDGKLNNTTPTTIRFIKQSTYNIEVKKTGYHSWSKNLFIEGGKVTYAGSVNDLIRLLPDSQPKNISDTNVRTSLIIGNRVLFITEDNNVGIYDLSQETIINQSPISANITQLDRTKNDNYLLGKTDDNQQYLLSTKTLKLIALPPQLTNSENIELINDDTIIAQHDHTLLSYNFVAKSAPKVIMDKVQGFTTNDSMVYVAQNGVITYFWDGKTLTKETVLYDGSIAQGQSTELYLTNHKELFLKVDKSLFRINDRPELINDQVELVNFNPIRQELTFTTPTEIYFYNFLSSQTELFYRTSQTSNQAVVVPELGYGFIANAQGVFGIEIDNRNGQNQYTLYGSTAVTGMQLSENENQLIILAGGKLYSLKVN